MSKLQIAEVSVVIPCFRCGDTIEQAIASVAGQSVRPAEIILVDDANDNECLGALYHCQQRYGARWIKIISLPENRGPGAARNTGWNAAQYPYIAFLDADDAWHPQKIELQYTWMRENSCVDMTTHYYSIEFRGRCLRPILYKREVLKARRITRNNILISNKCPTPCVMIKRAVSVRFSEDQHHSEDYFLWLQLVLSRRECYKLCLPLAFLFKQPVGGGGLSQDIWAMYRGQRRNFAIIRNQGYISNVEHFLLISWSFIKMFRRLSIIAFQKYREKRAWSI